MDSPDSEATFQSVRFFDHGDGPHAILAIEAFPEIARQVGTVLACFSIIEITTRDLLAKLLSVSQDEAGEIIWHLQSQAARAKIIEAVASTKPDSNIKSEARKLLGELAWARSKRNAYAHSQYSVPADDDDRRLVRIGWFADLRRKKEWETLTPETVGQDIERAKALIVSLWTFLK